MIDDKDIEILRLRGEIQLLEKQIDWFAAEQDFWRRKYLCEHPEHDNWDYVETALENEGEPV